LARFCSSACRHRPGPFGQLKPRRGVPYADPDGPLAKKAVAEGKSFSGIARGVAEGQNITTGRMVEAEEVRP